jgi:hypothetical protein
MAVINSLINILSVTVAETLDCAAVVIMFFIMLPLGMVVVLAFMPLGMVRHSGSGFYANLGCGSASMPLWILATLIILPTIGMVVLALMPLGAVVPAPMPIWVVVLA